MKRYNSGKQCASALKLMASAVMDINESYRFGLIEKIID